MPRISIIILCLSFIVNINLGYAQSYDGEGYLKESEILLDRNEIAKAKTLLLKALNQYSENELALCLLGKAYLLENNYADATRSFKKAYRINPNLSNDKLILYANALKQNGDYLESEKIFKIILNRKNATTDERRIIQNALYGINEVKNGSINAYVNSLSPIEANSSGSEIAPYPYDSASFTFGQTIKSEDGLAINNYIKKNETQTLIDINPSLGTMTNIQILSDEVFFSLCNDGLCNLYSATLDKNNKLKNISELKELNADGYSSTQAFVFKQNGSMVILFSSNRENKDGGAYDLYLSVRVKNGWTSPKALPSSINSTGNEVTPYFDGTYLYFASDYLPGLGGFDIFRAKSNNFISFSRAENIGTPFNSVANDLYFKLNPAQDNGFLSSNRIGSVVGSSETCCNDIYEFPWPPKLVEKAKKSTKIEEKKPYQNLIAELKATLPLTLYFHNDIPLPNQKVPTYTETYFPYKAMESEYLNKNYSTESKTFFNNTLAFEYSKLQSFTVLIQELLKSDVKIAFTVKGYASPLATNTYNKALSQRRIQSFINEIFAFKAGLFSSYRNNISIIEKPFGEEESNKTVSDDRKDPKNSIYAYGAINERKIEIVNIEEETEIVTQKSPGLKDKISNTDTLTFKVEDRPDVDTTTLKYGTRVDSITVKNPYSEKFIIATIEPSCGCTTASISQNYIDANGSIIMVTERDLVDGKAKPVTVSFISASPQKLPNFVIPLD